MRADALAIGRLTFRHEPAPGQAEGEIAGHLHPAARVIGRGKSVRRRCFAGDGYRLILPAFGAYAGGLDVLDRAFAGLFRKESFRAFVLGDDCGLSGRAARASGRMRWPRRRSFPSFYAAISRPVLHSTSALAVSASATTRPEDDFAYLDLDGAELMLEQITDGERSFVIGPLERPFGRGMNLQIEVADVDALHRRVGATSAQIVLALEERWYRRDREEVGNRQFIVADPDGYLLRFFTDLGRRAARAA